MPRATVIGNAIFAALGQQALGATVIFQLGAFKLTLATAVGYLVTTAITSWAMKAMAPKPSSFNNQSQGILVNSRSGLRHRFCLWQGTQRRHSNVL